MEWAIEECKKTTLPVAASMCIGPEGDMHGVSAAECAVRMARAGADIGRSQVLVFAPLDSFMSTKHSLASHNRMLRGQILSTRKWHYCLSLNTAGQFPLPHNSQLQILRLAKL